MTTKPKKRKQQAYSLPPSLVRMVRVEAAEQGVYPSVIVERRLCESYDREPISNKTA